jgi:hypothetical protein
MKDHLSKSSVLRNGPNGSCLSWKLHLILRNEWNGLETKGFRIKSMEENGIQ